MTAEDADAYNTNKKVIINYCTPFTDWIREINNKQVDNAKDIDVAMLVCNVIEYSKNYNITIQYNYIYC